MTFRSVIIGFLLALSLAALGWMNDWVLRQACFAGDLLPTSAYGLLIVGLMLVNPFLRLIGRCQLRGGEWCVILALMLVGAWVSGPNLLGTFDSTLVMPHHFNHNEQSWQEHHLLSYAPPQMLVDPDNQYDLVVKGFATGLKEGNKLIRWHGVPWWAWTRTLSFWIPILALVSIGGICVVLVVHRQWSQRELLRYPIAEFAGELLAGSGNRFLGGIFHKPRFWIGFGIAFGILMINGTNTWGQPLKWNTIQIPLAVNLRVILPTIFPFLMKYPFTWGITFPQFYFVVVGLAYFVSTEVCFTLGFSSFFHLLFYYILFQMGVAISEDYLGGGFFPYQKFGSSLGMGLIMLYVGRRFYGTLLLNVFCIPSGNRERANATEIWACRLAVLAGAVLTAILISVGLNWLLAVLFVFLTGLLFLVVTRVNVETGLFSVVINWHAVGIMMGMFGMAAIGPHMLIILALLGAVLTIDTKCCLMPLVANSLKFSEREGVRPARLGGVLAVGAVAAIVVGITVTLYFQYNYGTWQHVWPQMPGQRAFELIGEQMPIFETDILHRTSFPFADLSLNVRGFLVPAALGLALVLVFSFLRLRYQWWPIHPVLFVIWASWPMMCYGWSFIFGWMFKVVITRFGGGDGYRNNKPLFVGLVAGELAASIFWLAVGGWYYFHNNYVPGPPIRFHL